MVYPNHRLASPTRARVDPRSEAHPTAAELPTRRPASPGEAQPSRDAISADPSEQYHPRPDHADAVHTFMDDVLVHREALAGWLRARFPTISDTENLVQESVSRVWRAVSESPIRSPRALLFATAHNLAVDHVRRDRVARIEAIDAMPDLPVLEDGPDPAEAAARLQEIELLTDAVRALPDRCRQVLTLRKIYGLSQKQIAAQLGIAEHTVEAQVANGMRRVTQYLMRLGLP